MWLPVFKAITANVTVIMSILGFGGWISRLLPESFPRLTRSICAFVGGFGILGLVLFVVGYLSFTRWTIGVILTIGIGMAVFSKLRPWGIRRGIAILPAAIIAVVLVMTALSGLLEPIGDWNIDGVAYHLVGPKAWVRHGIFRPTPNNRATSSPPTVEMVFASLYAFGGDRAPGLSAA